MLIEDIKLAGGLIYPQKPVDPDTGKRGRGVINYTQDGKVVVPSLEAKDIDPNTKYFVISRGYIAFGGTTGLPNSEGYGTTSTGAFLYKTEKQVHGNKQVQTNNDKVRIGTAYSAPVLGGTLLSDATLAPIDFGVDDIKSSEGLQKTMSLLFMGQRVTNTQLKQLVQHPDFQITNSQLLKMVGESKDSDLAARLQILKPSNSAERLISTFVQFKFNPEPKYNHDKQTQETLTADVQEFLELWEKYE